MIERIARRAGGFASTTALRWLGAGKDAVAEAAPVAGTRHGNSGGRVAATAAAGAVALLSNKAVRTRVERGLLALSEKVRPDPTANGNGNGNGSNGNGSNGLSGKTRAELYELAKKMDVPGRSAMSKDELAKAVTR